MGIAEGVWPDRFSGSLILYSWHEIILYSLHQPIKPQGPRHTIQPNLGPAPSNQVKI